MIYLIITITISLTISFACSLFEACLLSLSLADIARLCAKYPKVGRIWLGFKKNIDHPIAVILIINTLAHTIGASLSGAIFESLFSSSLIIIFSLLYSFAMIQFTEILPKTLGVKHNRRLAIISAVPLNFLIKLFTPLVFVVHSINLLFTGKKKAEDKIDPLGEITALAHFAQSSAQITKNQERILAQALKLSSIRLKDIMVPQPDIKYLTTTMSLTEALLAAHLHHHTRFPLLDPAKDEFIGYVNFKDIVTALRLNPQDPSLKGIARPLLRLDENETISNALNRLTSAYQHIALVHNSQHKVLGLITLENLLETIVGDVKDEYDLLPVHFFQLSPTRFLAGGGLSLGQLNQKLNTALPDEQKSLSDWLASRIEFSSPDRKYSHGNLLFEVRKVSHSRIYEVIIDISPT